MEGNGNHIEWLRAPHHRATWELLDHFTIETTEDQGVGHPQRAICKICRQNFTLPDDRYEMLEFQRHSEECLKEMERMEARFAAEDLPDRTLKNVQYDVRYDEEGKKNEIWLFSYRAGGSTTSR